MTREELRATILGALVTIAPEAESLTLDPRADLREALDLDSMDILRFATLLRDRAGVEVPEADYARIVSLDGCLDYLCARV